MALSFDATYYMSARPDVLNAYIAAGAEVGTGMNWAQFAEQHFNNFGWKEGYNPNAIFDTTEYLAANIDVLNAGVNPFQHYLQFGAYEKRAPSDSFPSFASFDAAAYLAANPDLGTAGIDTPEAAYGHFVIFGQFEDRPGAPQIDHGLPGVTSTLTTGIDNFSVAGGQATNGNDLFLAVANGGTVADGTTFNNGDTINGGAGKDVLRVVTSANTSTTPNLTSVETIDGQVFNGAALTVNLATSTGVEKLSLSNGNGSMIAQNGATLVDLELNNTTGGTLTATYAAATVAGLTDVQNVALNNTANSGVNVAGVETVNIAVTGANTNTTLTANAATTLNVSGSGSLALFNAVGAAVTTFDASANTGGVRATFAAGGNVTATGGSGDDTFDFGAGLTANTAAVAGDVVNGGEGFDTVRVTLAGAAANISAAAAAAPFNGLTSIERVAFDGATGVTLNGATFTNAGVTNIEMNTFGDDIINNAASARTYEFGAANGGNATFNMNGTSTALNIDLLGTVGATPVNGPTNTVEVAGLTVNLAGTQPAGTVAAITLTSNGNFTAGTITDVGGTLGLTAGTFNSIGQINAVSGSSLTIDGAAALDIGSSVNNIVVDASAHTGGLVIQGSAVIAGNEGTVGTSATVLSQGFDTITLGSGRDVLQFNSNGLDSGIIQVTGSGATAAANGNILHDTVIGFTAGANGDILDITGTVASYKALAAASQAAIDALSGAGATLLAAANLAANGNDVAGWTAFSFQGATYALYEGNADVAGGFVNADTLVQLTGVAVADLTAANFA